METCISLAEPHVEHQAQLAKPCMGMTRRFLTAVDRDSDWATYHSNGCRPMPWPLKQGIREDVQNEKQLLKGHGLEKWCQRKTSRQGQGHSKSGTRSARCPVEYDSMTEVEKITYRVARD